MRNDSLVLSVPYTTYTISPAYSREKWRTEAMACAAIEALEVNRLDRDRNGRRGAGIGALIGIGGACAGVALMEDPDQWASSVLEPAVLAAGLGGIHGYVVGAGGKPAVYGLLAGVAVGVPIGASWREGDMPGWGAALIGAGLFGEIGLVIGTLAGAMAPADAWEELPLDRIRVGIRPSYHHGAVLSVWWNH